MLLEDRVIDIVNKVLSLRHSYDSLYKDAPLTGAPLYAEPGEMVYIVLELMETFQIVFDEEDFRDYRFNTVNGIINAVNRHVQTEEE